MHKGILIFIGFVVLALFVSACTKLGTTAGAEQQPETNTPQINTQATNVDNATDITADISITTPEDVATLDDLNVSDNIPQ